VEERVEPDLVRRGGGVQVRHVQRVIGLGRRVGELVAVEVDDRGLFQQARHQPVQVGEVHRLAGKEQIDPPHPVTRQLLGKPVGGGGESSLDPPRREFEERPAVSAVVDERLQHVATPPAVERLEGEDVELAAHGCGIARVGS
jgi:hypothetical protein